MSHEFQFLRGDPSCVSFGSVKCRNVLHCRVKNGSDTEQEISMADVKHFSARLSRRRRNPNRGQAKRGDEVIMFKSTNSSLTPRKTMRARLLALLGLSGSVWATPALFTVEDMLAAPRPFPAIASPDKQHAIAVVDYWEPRDDSYVLRSCP